MANVAAQGMKSYGVWLERDGANNDKLVAAWRKVSSIKPAKTIGGPYKVPLIIMDASFHVWLEAFLWRSCHVYVLWV